MHGWHCSNSASQCLFLFHFFYFKATARGSRNGDNVRLIFMRTCSSLSIVTKIFSPLAWFTYMIRVCEPFLHHSHCLSHLTKFPPYDRPIRKSDLAAIAFSTSNDPIELVCLCNTTPNDISFPQLLLHNVLIWNLYPSQKSAVRPSNDGNARVCCVCGTAGFVGNYFIGDGRAVVFGKVFGTDFNWWDSVFP